MQEFDLLVVGSGPGGQRAAIAAAKLGRRVAIVDRKGMVGGVCVNTGTIPSKTLREAVLYLTGTQPARALRRELPGQGRTSPIADLTARTHHVIARESEVVRTQLHRNHVQVLPGHRPLPRPAHDAGDRRARRRGVQAHRRQDRHRHRHPARAAEGDRVRRAAHRRLRRRARPRPHPGARWWSSAPGSSASSTRRCSPRSAPGSRSSSAATSMIDFVDAEVVEALKFHLRDLSVTFRFNETVDSVQPDRQGDADHAAQRQADPGRGRHVLGRPAGRHREPRPGEGRARAPTSAAASRSTRTSAPPSRTSTPWAT